MSNNEEGLVGNVIKKNYIIPKYQRGYRWCKDNVQKLLEDIYEDILPIKEEIIDEINKASTSNKAFSIFEKTHGNKPQYCIQPLVVVRNGTEKYSIIDGQQRLTTISIIISVLKNLDAEVGPDNIGEIKYESRKKSEDYLRKLFEDGSTENIDNENIDNEYMRQAFEAAKDFFENNVNGIKDNYKKTIYNFLYDHLLNKIYFIWYEPEECTSEQDVFAKYNTGKIALTNSELIKAEFMNPTNYGGKISRAAQIVISEKWDEIETRLHEEELWAFIPHENQYDSGNYITRIDAIFELYAIKKHQPISPSSFGLYEAVKDILLNTIQDKENKEEAIKACWDDITLVFTELLDLYSNNITYNLAGLYIYLCRDGSYKETYKKLLDNIITKDRDTHNKELCSLIKGKVFGNVNVDISKKLKSLKHPNDIVVIRNVMLLYNIAMLIKTDANNARYSFRLHSKENWDCEHIFATNVENKDKNVDEIIKRNTIELLRIQNGQDNDYTKYVKYLYGDNIFDKDSDGKYKTGCEMRNNAAKAEEKANELYDYYCQIEKIESILMYDGRNSLFEALIKEFFTDFKVTQYERRKINIKYDDNFEKWANDLNNTTNDQCNKITKDSNIYEWEYDPKAFTDFEKLKENMILSFNNHVDKILKSDNLNFEIMTALLKLAKKTMYGLIAEFFNKETVNDNVNTSLTLNQLLHDDSLGNMTLLRDIENRSHEVTNNPYYKKKENIYDAFSKGQFVPYGTLMVFSGQYNTSKVTDNYWLPASRQNYLEKLIKEITELLK